MIKVQGEMYTNRCQLPIIQLPWSESICIENTFFKLILDTYGAMWSLVWATRELLFKCKGFITIMQNKQSENRFSGLQNHIVIQTST